MHDFADGSNRSTFQRSLDHLRAQIDEIDSDIIGLLGRRFETTRKIGRLKAEHEADPVDVDREVAVFAARRTLAAAHGVPPATIDAIYQLVVTQVVSEHHAVRQPRQKAAERTAPSDLIMSNPPTAEAC